MIRLSIKDKLDQIKFALDLTDEDLAKKLKVERMTLYRWRNGLSNPHTANWATLDRLHASCSNALLDKAETKVKK